MADNTMGDGLNIPLNINPEGFDQVTDALTSISEMIKDARSDLEAWNDAVSDTQEKFANLTSEFEKQLDFRNQMIDVERQIRDITEVTKDNARDIAGYYSQLASTLAGLGVTNLSGGGIPSGLSGAPSPSTAPVSTGGGGVGGGGGMPMSPFIPQMGGASVRAPGPISRTLQRGNQAIQSLGQAEYTWNQMFPMQIPDPANPGSFIPNPNYRPFPGQSVLSKLGGFGELAGKFGTYAYAAEKLYGAVAGQFQSAQGYTGVTGGTSVTEATGLDLQAQAEAGFGLNPLMDSKTAKEIITNNLAMGYQQGSQLFAQGKDFGFYAKERYGIDSQTSVAMFDTMVAKAGGSAAQLQVSLDKLSRVASTTGASFTVMQQQLQQYSQSYYQAGVTGPAATELATVAATYAAVGGAVTRGTGTQADLASSQTGRMLIAQQLGISPTQLASFEHFQDKSGIKMAGAEDAVARRFLAQRGLTKDSTDKDFWDNTYFIDQIFQMLGIKGDNPDGSWSPNAAVRRAKQIVKGGGLVGALQHQAAKEQKQLDKLVASGDLLGSSTGLGSKAANIALDATGVGSFLNFHDYGKLGDAFVHKFGKGHDIMVQYNGKNYSIAEAQADPAVQRALAEGKAKVAKFDEGKKTSQWMTAASLMGLEGAKNRQKETQTKVIAEPGPKLQGWIRFHSAETGGTSNSNR